MFGRCEALLQRGEYGGEILFQEMGRAEPKAGEGSAAEDAIRPGQTFVLRAAKDEPIKLAV
jgi:hypothetical protein